MAGKTRPGFDATATPCKKGQKISVGIVHKCTSRSTKAASRCLFHRPVRPPRRAKHSVLILELRGGLAWPALRSESGREEKVEAGRSSHPFKTSSPFFTKRMDKDYGGSPLKKTGMAERSFNADAKVFLLALATLSSFSQCDLTTTQQSRAQLLLFFSSPHTLQLFARLPGVCAFAPVV